MKRPVALCLTVLFLTTGTSRAFEPTLEGNKGVESWPMVRGDHIGNPLLDSAGDLTKGTARKERFIDVPAWIVSEDFDEDDISEAVVQFTDGTIRILRLTKGKLRTVATVNIMSPDSPPVAVVSVGSETTGGLIGVDSRGDLVTVDHKSGTTRRLDSGYSPLTYPVPADLDGDGMTEIAAVSDEGLMTIVKGRTRTRSDSSVRLLPDTRITITDLDGDGTLEIVAFSKPRELLSNGRLGDDLDAGGLAVFSWDGRTIDFEDEYELPENQVFEMLTPIVVSEDGGEAVQMILTVTEEGAGSSLRSYTYKRGRIRDRKKGPVAEDLAWIHPIGGAVIGDSEYVSVIAAVQDGQKGGGLVLSRTNLTSTTLTLKSAIRTHTAGSRLLETALIGDFDHDGLLEILAPGVDMTSLEIFILNRRRLRGKEIFRGSAAIVTNMCPGDFDGDGKGDVMFGLDDGTIVILTGD